MIKLTEANREFKKAVDYIKQNTTAWDDKRNLKLYDISMYDYNNDFPLCYEEDKNTEYNNFLLFCEDNYRLFMDWMTEENIDKNIFNYIGMSSWFTLGKYADRRLFYGISDILEDCYNFDYIDFSEDFEIFPYGNWDVAKEEVQAELEYIVNELYKDVKYRLEDIIKVANYVDTFKSNSLEDFKSFLEMRECDLQDQKEEREKHNEKIRKTIEKSNLTAEEKKFLKKNLEVK